MDDILLNFRGAKFLLPLKFHLLIFIMNLQSSNTTRVQSIDIFRGLTILVMIFVNDVASVDGLPWWTYHIPPGVNGITYVDVVFPAFLFIVGMAIPLAMQRRQAKGHTPQRIVYHVMVRSVSLIVIGLLIMNGRSMDPEATGISYALWNTLMFIGVILVWNVYPNNKQLLHKILKWSGVVLLVVLLVIYRRNIKGEIVWINPRNWSILGGIGWAYLSVCILYLLARGRVWMLTLSFILLVLLNTLGKLGLADFIKTIPVFLWPFGNGSLASITMAGAILSRIFLGSDHAPKLKDKLLISSGLGLSLLLAGWLLLPLGLAKIGSTPSWCLISAGICIFVFILLYIVVDVKGYSGWAQFVRPAGSNPLLTYILPDIYYAIFGLHHFGAIAGTGLPGVMRAFLFTLFILGVSAILTRYKIRLQL